MEREKNDLFKKIPLGFREKFIQEILCRTTPADVIRVSLVSKDFQWSANCDVVWDTFIPSRHRKQVLDGTRYRTFNSSKQIFFELCTWDVVDKNNDDHVRFWLDKWSGKTCLKIGHKDLEITQLDTDYWKKSNGYPVLGHVVWLEVYGKMTTSRLSPNTAYEAYLFFTLSDYLCYGLHLPIEASVGIAGEENRKEIVYLDPRIAKSKNNHHYPNEERRERDLLLEVKLGEYFHMEGENRDVEITLKEVKSGRPKCGVYIAGMEMRPNHNI